MTKDAIDTRVDSLIRGNTKKIGDEVDREALREMLRDTIEMLGPELFKDNEVRTEFRQAVSKGCDYAISFCNAKLPEIIPNVK